MYKIQVIKTIDELSSIKDEWVQLLKMCEVITPYQRWEWSYSWAKSMRRIENLFIVTIRDDNGHIVCIVPLKIRKVFGILNILSFIGQEASIYPDFIIANNETESLIKAFARYLNENTSIGSLDLIMADPTKTLNLLRQALYELGWYKVNAVDYTKRLIVDLGAGYQKYLKTLSGKMRQEIKSETNKLQNRYNVRFFATDATSDFEWAMSTLFHLNSLKWGGDADKNHIERRECYRLEHKTERARIFILTCDDKPVGALSAFIFYDTIFAEVAGFDYSIGKYDLGKIFYHYLFQWVEERGYKKIDLSSGEEPYKFRYNPEIISKWHLIAFRNKVISGAVHFNNKSEDIIIKMKRHFVKYINFSSPVVHMLFEKIKNSYSNSKYKYIAI